MTSSELLQLVENCPTGAETLIARILNIITDKGRQFPVLFICCLLFLLLLLLLGWTVLICSIKTKTEYFFSFPAAPSAELVKRVKELYHKRVSDVRFLIPVLTGLEKQEIIAVLPKLVKQSPNVVKEVFNRLLGCFHSKYLDCMCLVRTFSSESLR